MIDIEKKKFCTGCKTYKHLLDFKVIRNGRVSPTCLNCRAEHSYEQYMRTYDKRITKYEEENYQEWEKNKGS